MHNFEITHTFEVKASELYNCWLDSGLHSKMTGGEANCSHQVGENFTAWDGYIKGLNKELVKNVKIRQSWRTLDFKENDPDSEITITFQAFENSCEFKLIHSKIPDGQPDYKKGWYDHYINPMTTYLTK